MKNSKLLALVRVLKPKILKRASIYMQSGLFQRRPHIGRLMAYLMKYGHNDKAIEREKVYKHVFGTKKYDDLKFRHAVADVFTALERFMLWENLQEEEVYLSTKLLRMYKGLNLEKHHNGVLNSLQKRRSKNTLKGGDYYHQEYLLTLEQLEFSFIADMKQRRALLNDTLHNLDVYYIHQKLKMFSTMITFHRRIGSEIDMFLLESIIEEVKKGPLLEIAEIGIYYNIVQSMLHEENEPYFQAFLQLFQANIQFFPTDEARDITYFAFNFCTGKINRGQSEYLDILFELYKLSIEYETIFEMGVLSPHNYKNIAKVSLRLKAYKWALNFIETYKNRLQSHQESAYNYSLANYYFYQKDFKKTQQLLLQIEYEDIFYGLDARALLLKTYYETDEINALYSLIDSFKQYLRRAKSLTQARKQTYSNFIKFAKKLVQISFTTSEKLLALKEELNTTPKVADRNWIVTKIEEQLKDY